MLRHSLDFVSCKDRKTVATALEGIYRAVDAVAAEEALTAFEGGLWGKKYLAIDPSWRLGDGQGPIRRIVRRALPAGNGGINVNQPAPTQNP